MPLILKNNYLGTRDEPWTWQTLLQVRNVGYSVMKTPHIGNQHPSNLLCAALGIHMDMVTFTQGEKDLNFHPHLRIAGGIARQLYEASIYTPFAVVTDGQSAEDYHQRSVRERFVGTLVTTDIELLHQELEVSVRVLEASTKSLPGLWYRHVDSTGVVTRVTEPPVETLLPNIFRVTSATSGFVIPNRLHMMVTFIWQILSTGRDTVYHLSGPDMVGYIGKLESGLSRMYDAIRTVVPGLPDVLTVYVVPVAQSRFVTHITRRDSLEALLDTIAWYERQDVTKRAEATSVVKNAGGLYPEFGRSISRGDFLSQYDLVSVADLYVPDWLLTTPLSRVKRFAELVALEANDLIQAA
ncbi:MAG: hypothetical protein RLZZ70_571 [Candidatus Parcubacteria bacterium]|jgi:hypothetical protein